MLGTYSKKFNWTYQKVLCLPGHLAHSAGMFCGTFLSPGPLLSKLDNVGKSTSSLLPLSSTNFLFMESRVRQLAVQGWYMPVSLSKREWGCGLDVQLLGAANPSQIPQHSHNEVSIILVSESSGDSLAQPVSYPPTTFHAILVFKRFCETSMYCIILLMIVQKLNHANSEFRIQNLSSPIVNGL